MRELEVLVMLLNIDLLNHLFDNTKKIKYRIRLRQLSNNLYKIQIQGSQEFISI